MKKIALIFLIAALAAGIFGLAWYLGSEKEQVRYVSMTKLYLESDYNKKFQKDLKTLENTSNSQLAEIQKGIREYKAANADPKFIKELEDELLRKRDLLTADYEKRSKEFDKIIWENINSAISEYGKEHHIDFILGAKGDGTIMYASDRCDITDELIQFIHTKK